MRWHLRWLSVALLACAFAAPAFAQKGLLGEETCGDHGTSIKFEKSVKDAAKKAEKEQKLVLAIHISGYFEEPDYT